MDTKAIAELEMLVANNMATGGIRSVTIELTDGTQVEGFVSAYSPSFTGLPDMTFTPSIGGSNFTLRWAQVRRVDVDMYKGGVQTFQINR